MADSKITALTALTAADPVNDMFPVVDVSDTTMAASGTTKKISVNNILSSSPTASGALTVTGLVTAGSATITGDLTVDTNTLKVDSANDRVGIGTASPAQFVHLSKSSTSTALTSPPVGGASLRIQNTSSTNNNFGSVEFYNANGLFGGSVNCQFTNQATPTNDLVFVTRGSSGGLEHYRIAADGVCTWSEVGGVAGTAMTLNSTGLGVGVTPSYAFHAKKTLSGTSTTVNGLLYLENNGAGNSAKITLTDGLSNDGYIVYSNETGNPLLGLGVGSAQQLVVNSSGNVGVGVTPAAGGGCLQIKSGITFPATQVASSDANTLDDYEEGTWVPTDASGAGLAFTVASCRYTKVGRLVTVQGSITYPATVSGATTSWGGFPFNAGDIFALKIIYSDAPIANVTYISSNTVNAFLLTPGANVSNATMSGKNVIFSGTYMV